MSNLIRLVYASRANFKAASSQGGVEPTVARILFQSRRNNPREELGGVLYYGNGYFFQCLEGEAEAVNLLLAKLQNDDRHTDVKTLSIEPVHERLFSAWSMKYVPVESSIKDLLQRYGKKEFNPFELSAPLIQDMLVLFGQLAHSESQPDQNYGGSGVTRAWAKLKNALT